MIVGTHTDKRRAVELEEIKLVRNCGLLLDLLIVTMKACIEYGAIPVVEMCLKENANNNDSDDQMNPMLALQILLQLMIRKRSHLVYFPEFVIIIYLGFYTQQIASNETKHGILFQ